MQVDEIPTLVFQGQCQLVSVERLGSLDNLYGFVGSFQSQLVFALAVVGIGELREMVGHGRQEFHVTRSLDGLLAVFDGLVHLACAAEEFTGHAQQVVRLDVESQLVIGLDGPHHLILRLVIIAQRMIYEGQIEVGSRELHRVPRLLADALCLLGRLNGLSVVAGLEEAVGTVAEQGGMDVAGRIEGVGFLVASGQLQCPADIGHGLLIV